MLTIREMTPGDEEHIIPLFKLFYDSPAVTAPVPQSILDSSFAAACNENENLLGLVFLENGKIIGYCLLTSYFACEVGGNCVMIEEIFFLDEYCGKGYGSYVFAYILENFGDAKRFRLEVCASNEGAVRLYKKLGFTNIPYDQMILDI